MRSSFLVLAAALAAAPLPALAAPGSSSPSGVGAGVSCEAVRADPSLYSHRVIQDCRRMGWHSEPASYGGQLYQPNGGMTDLVTRNSSCSDVHMRPDLYSASVRESCASGTVNGVGDWGGALVH